MQTQVSAGVQCSLVLGGGGPLGIAWEAGMLQGWADVWTSRGPTSDPMLAFLEGRIIGTSAGAIVGAHLAAYGSVTALVAQQDQPIGPDAPAAPKMALFMAAFLKAKLFSRSVPALRRSIGKSARRAALAGEAEWIAAIARSYAPTGPWPDSRELVVTVIDAETGELHAWRSDSGVPLALAVAASCAVPCAFPLVHIGGKVYMDGGIGSSTNAALAAGSGRILVLDPLGRMLGKSSPLDAERRALEADGSHTLAFLPDETVAAAIGMNMLDASRRSKVAALGRTQGHATAAGVLSFLQSTGVRHA